MRYVQHNVGMQLWATTHDTIYLHVPVYSLHTNGARSVENYRCATHYKMHNTSS
jgi:hypothetical protein